MLFTIFDTKIKPVILYGAEIWGVRRYEDIDHVHIQFCKLVLNVGKTTWNFAAIGECGRYPLYVDYHCRAIKYWCKLLSYSDSKYAKNVILYCTSMICLEDETGQQI